MYGSTCFGRPHAHNQEFNNCSSSLGFCRWSVVVAVLLVVVGPAEMDRSCGMHWKCDVLHARRGILLSVM